MGSPAKRELPAADGWRSSENVLVKMMSGLSRGRITAPVLTALFILAGLWAGLWQAGGVLAQTEEDSPRQVIVNEVSGPYEIVVAVTGARSILGPQRMTVTVRDVASGDWITDARVSIFGTPPDGGRRNYSPALNSPFDPTTYISQISLNEDGAWIIDVEVTGAAGLVATAGVLEVEPRVRGSASVPYGTAVLGLIILAFVGGAGWLGLQSRKAMKLRELAAAADGPASSKKPRPT